MRDRLHSDPRRDAHLDAPQWPVRRMAARAGTLARIKLRAAAPAIVEVAGRHAGRLTGGAPRRAPGGGWGCRRGGRPASYWDHAATNRSSAANRPFKALFK